MTGNTLDKQTAAFIAAIASNLPPMRGQDMQMLIERPKALQQLLRRSFAGPQDPRFTEMGLPKHKLCPLQTWGLSNGAKVEVEGKNPFLLYDCHPNLGIGVEYSSLESGKRLSLRLHLQLEHSNAEWVYNLPCKVVLDPFLYPQVSYARTFLEEDIGVADFVQRLEQDCVQEEMHRWVDYARTLRVSAASTYTWDFSIRFTKQGKHARVFNFKLWKRDIERTIEETKKKAI